MNIENKNIYEKAKQKSVNGLEKIERVKYTKKDLKEAREKGFNNGAKKGLKRGFLLGATAAILACGGIALGVQKIDNVINANYSNPSVTAGLNAVQTEAHLTEDKQHYWYDYYDIMKAYDSQTMDFDSFVYGNYQGIGWDTSSRLNCMDELFNQFNKNDITDCESFLDYCKEKGLCKEVDGKLQVDSNSYEKAVKDYLQTMNDVQELENNIDGFRHRM